MIWISLIILLAYMIYAGVTVGITPTLSETFYRVRLKWAFTVALDLTALTLLPEWLNISSSNISALAFFACAALCFVGTSPAFKTGMDKQVHFRGLIISIISLIAWCVFAGLWYIPAISVLLGILLSLRYLQYWGYIMECSAFVTAYASVFVSKYIL